MTSSVVLVTGAASGIGHAVTLTAAARGARVAALDIDGDRLAAVADEAREAGSPTVLALQVDVRDEPSVEAALSQCREAFGAPTAVLANAGIEVNSPPHEMTLEQWQRVIDVNLTGVFLTTRLAIAAMLDEGIRGSVVCTSSPSAFVGFSGGGNAAYAASKGGISALVRSLALDYAPAGIRVNAVVPGATDTPLLTVGVAGAERATARAEIARLAGEQIPLGRLGAPVEIAEAVLWLWSEAASYVTGSHLTVDGGLMAKSANTL
jgi:NAD(P)-dependent dehydrogenase (short-subunit alcohol dehydrogenase family)